MVLARRLPTQRDLDSNQLGLYLTQMGIAKLEAIQRWEVGLGWCWLEWLANQLGLGLKLKGCQSQMGLGLKSNVGTRGSEYNLGVSLLETPLSLTWLVVA